MSWSIQLIGKPDKVVEAIEATYQKMTDVASKREFGAAKPHLIGLVRENYSADAATTPIARLTASGSGSEKTLHDDKGQVSQTREVTQRQCSVQIETLYGALV